jgi:hypothetical protein
MACRSTGGEEEAKKMIDALRQLVEQLTGTGAVIVVPPARVPPEGLTEHSDVYTGRITFACPAGLAPPSENPEADFHVRRRSNAVHMAPLRASAPIYGIEGDVFTDNFIVRR